MVAAAAATVDAAMLEHGCMPSLMLRKPNSPATNAEQPELSGQTGAVVAATALRPGVRDPYVPDVFFTMQRHTQRQHNLLRYHGVHTCGRLHASGGASTLTLTGTACCHRDAEERVCGRPMAT